MGWLSVSYEWDARSLQLFCVLLGVRIALQVLDVTVHLSMFFSDQGIVPRGDVLAETDQAAVNIYLASSSGFVVIILAVHFVCALCIVFRFNLALALLIAYVLEYSLSDRWGALRVGGLDQAFLSVMLWSLVLPLQQGSFWPRANLHLLPLHASMIYCGAGWLKSGWEWSDGNAIYIALGSSMARRNSIVALLRQSPDLCSVLTLSSLLLERVGWIGLWVPVPLVRMLVLLAYAGLHIGIYLTIDVLDFHLVMLCPLVAMLPTSFWTLGGSILQWVRRELGAGGYVLRGLQVSAWWGRYIGTVKPVLQKGWCLFELLPETLRCTSRCQVIDLHILHPQTVNRAVLLLSGIVWYMAICTIGRSLPPCIGWGLDHAEKLPGIRSLGIKQPLDLFAPRPINPDHWVALYGETKDGSLLDLMYDGHLANGRLIRVEDINREQRRYVRHHRWFKLFKRKRFYSGSEARALGLPYVASFASRSMMDMC